MTLMSLPLGKERAGHPERISFYELIKVQIKYIFLLDIRQICFLRPYFIASISVVFQSDISNSRDLVTSFNRLEQSKDIEVMYISLKKIPNVP